MRALLAAMVCLVSGCRVPANELEVIPGAVFVLDAGTASDAGSESDAGCWSAPLVIAPHNVWGLGGLVVMPEGHALTVWSPLDGGPPRDLSSRFLWLSGNLSEPTRFFTPAPGQAELRFVRLAANHRGQAVAAFIVRLEGGGHEVWASRFQPETAWRPAERLSEGAQVTIDELQAAVDSDGVTLVSWRQPASLNDPGALVARVWSGSTWLPLQALSQPGALPSNSVVKAGGGPLIVAAWRETSAPDHRHRLHAMSWYMGVRRDALFPELEQVNAPALAVNDVQALVFSTGRQLPAVDSLVGRFEFGEWTQARFSALDSGVLGGTLGVDEAGRFRLWWLEVTTGSTRLFTAADFSGAWVDRRVVMEQASPPGPYLPQASNAQGRGLLAWVRDGENVVFRTEGDAGVIDRLDGVIIDGAGEPLHVGRSGARWLLVHEREAPNRALGLFCR